LKYQKEMKIRNTVLSMAIREIQWLKIQCNLVAAIYAAAAKRASENRFAALLLSLF